MKRAIVLIGLLVLGACAPQRPSIPPGVIPQEEPVSTEDEQYGHEVLNQLTEHYQLDQDDAHINRVRSIVDRLTKAAHADANPWNVFVLTDPEFTNAAATRGNFVFVWTPMLRAVQSDDELATVLAHEIGHVLAGHTAPNPREEVSRMIAGVAGMATGAIVSQRTGFGVPDIAESVVRSGLEALLINPASQQRELEADQIGLFLMSDAGYNPEDAVRFWTRAQHDSRFSNGGLEFLSTHPSSAERLARLQALLPEAKERFEHHGAPTHDLREVTRTPPRTPSRFSNRPYAHVKRSESEVWTVEEAKSAIHRDPTSQSAPVTTLRHGDRVTVVGRIGRWLQIDSPMRGYILGSDLTPP